MESGGLSDVLVLALSDDSDRDRQGLVRDGGECHDCDRVDVVMHRANRPCCGACTMLARKMMRDCMTGAVDVVCGSGEAAQSVTLARKLTAQGQKRVCSLVSMS